MGFDVSYHPISENEIDEWYFTVLADVKNGNTGTARALAQSRGMDEFYINKYVDTLNTGAQTTPQDLFEKTHGFYIAVIQGFFRTYFYTRGAAFTFLIEEDASFRQYTKPWEEILRVPVENPIKNQIVENYCSGVYLPFDKLSKFLDDYAGTRESKDKIDAVFSHKRIDVFLKAVRFAVENKLGILEATEVVEPHPFDLNKSGSYSNLFNCDKDGAFLYQEAALEQVSQIDLNPKPAKKKGFFGKLFGGK